MARATAPDVRFDFRKGVNDSHSEDIMDAFEVVQCKNMRAHEEHGALVKRGPTQRVHVSQLESGATVTGLFQWTNPSGNNELVCICNGHFFHKEESDSNFTKVASTFSTSERVRFMTHREGAAIVLYMAAGASIFKWDGTTLTTSISGAPDALDLVLYKGRAFGIEDDKTLHYTDVTAPEDWNSTADVETFDTEPLIGLTVVGSSLALAKADTIARFTGVDQAEIQIDRDTEGISVQAGVAARLTLINADEVGFFLSDRGPYLFTEAGIQYVGKNIEGWLGTVNPEYRHLACAGYNRRKREIVLACPTGTSTTNDECMVFSMVTQAWSGPFAFSFDIACLCRYEYDDGTESLAAGGYDGRVRDIDVFDATLDHKDDILRDDTGGTAIAAEVELPELIFGAPGQVKSLARVQVVMADLGASGELDIDWSNEHGDSGTLPAISSKGAGVDRYSWKSKARGTRIGLSLREETANPFVLAGLKLEANFSGRAL